MTAGAGTYAPSSIAIDNSFGSSALQKQVHSILYDGLEKPVTSGPDMKATMPAGDDELVYKSDE